MSPVFLGFEDMLLTVLAILVIIIFGGCLYALLYSIFIFVFSQGDPEKKKSAWNSIRYMIIGLIFTIVLLTVFPVAFKQLNVKGYEVYTVSSVFGRVGEIFNKLVDFGRLVGEINRSGPDYNPRYQDYNL